MHKLKVKDDELCFFYRKLKVKSSKEVKRKTNAFEKLFKKIKGLNVLTLILVSILWNKSLRQRYFGSFCERLSFQKIQKESLESFCF